MKRGLPSFVAASIFLGACSGGGGSSTPVSTTPSLDLLAGSADASGFVDASGAAARFGIIGGMAIDASGIVIVTDVPKGAVRTVTPDGLVGTLAGGTSLGARDGSGP